MRYAKISVEKDCGQHIKSRSSDVNIMDQEQVGRPSKPKYSGNRSYAFDDLVNMFENMSTQKSQDDSVLTEKLGNSTSANLPTNRLPLDESSSPVNEDLSSAHSNRCIGPVSGCPSTNQHHSPQTPSNTSQTTNKSPPRASAHRFKQLRNSIKRMFQRSAPVSSSQSSSTINDSTVVQCKQVQQRKVAVREKLNVCLKRFKSTSRRIDTSRSKNNHESVFKNENKYVIGVCGVDFHLYKFNTGIENHAQKTIVTLHDIAHNSQSNFENIFSNQQLVDLIYQENCTVWHVCLPGHDLDERSAVVGRYPGFVELSKMITILVADNLKTDCCIGVGIGAGADLLIRSSLLAPSLYSHLVCVNLKLRSTDKVKLVNYPLIFNPISHHLNNYGIEYFESRCIKQFCATTVNIESLRKYKHFLKAIKQNPNLSQLALRYWRRPDIDYYSEEVYRRLESIPKILIKPKVLLIEGLVNPEKNTKGDLLDFVFPGKRLYECFDNGSKLVLDEYTDHIAELVIKFIQNQLH